MAGALGVLATFAGLSPWWSAYGGYWLLASGLLATYIGAFIAWKNANDKATKLNSSLAEMVRARDERDEYIDALQLPVFSIEIGRQDFQKRETQQHLPGGEVREVTVIDGAIHLTIRNNGAETSIHNWRGYLFYDGAGLEASVMVSRQSDMSRYSVDEIGRNKTIQVAVHIMSGPINDLNPDGSITGWVVQFQDVLNRMPKCWQPPSADPPFDHIDPTTNKPVGIP